MTSEQAIACARTIAFDRDWPWLPPVRAARRRPFFIGPVRWEVWSNADMRGLNVRVVIDDASGRVLTQLFVPR
jgi:hypothetical protein